MSLESNIKEISTTTGDALAWGAAIGYLALLVLLFVGLFAAAHFVFGWPV